MPTPPPEPVKIGALPRDLPRDALAGAEGVATVLAASGADPLLRLTLGDMEVHELDSPVGSTFSVQVTARHGGQVHEATWAFRVTGDDADVVQPVVGPGLRVERGRWGRRTYEGFEFGVLVMGAQLVEG